MIEASRIKKLAELMGVEVGEEFVLRGFLDSRYKITSEGLFIFCKDGSGIRGWVSARISVNQLLSNKPIRLPYEPKCGDSYYYPCPNSPDGVVFAVNDASESFVKVFKRVGVYKTREEALEKARELWGE